MSDERPAVRPAPGVTPRFAAAPPKTSPAPLGSGLRIPLWHRAAEVLIRVMAVAAIAAVLLIFLFVLKEALPLLWEADAIEEIGGLSSLFLPRQWFGYDDAVYIWQPVGSPPKFNLVPLVVGTLKVTWLSMLISVPLGIGSAIFVAHYAPPRTREVLKSLLELLASVPSVVIGFFALMVLASWVDQVFGFTYRLNVVVAALGLSLAVVPLIFTISEDAMRVVPSALIEAAYALGARKWQTVLRVVLPSALPGIAAAVILGFGRAIGETMVVLMASGNAAVLRPLDFSTSARTMTATVAAELGEVVRGDAHWRVLFLLGVLLFAITFATNRLGAWVVERLHRRLTASG